MTSSRQHTDKPSPPHLFAKRGLYETFHQSLKKLKWKRSNESVLLGLSGGRDSTVLLHLLLVSGYSVTAAHLNHLLRGKESQQDEAFVRELCRVWKVPLMVDKQNISKLAKKHSLSIEEAARIARYQFFEKVASKRGVKKVVTAHHQNDQAETILLRIFFGSDRKTLHGMEPIRPLPILHWSKKSSHQKSSIKLVRPLLSAPYSEILRYSKQNKIPFRQDGSNLDLTYPRNWVRHRLIPLIEKKLRRNVVKTLARLAE